MAELVKCPHCGSYDTAKTKNGKVSSALSTAGGILGGALLQLVTGVPGMLGANAAIGQTWHQYYCSHCHAAFKVRLSASGAVKETKKY